MEIKLTFSELQIVVRALEKEHYEDLNNHDLSVLLSRLIDVEKKKKNHEY